MPEDLFGDSKTSTVGSKSKSDAKQMMKHMRIARQHPNASRFSAHEAAAGIMVNTRARRVADEERVLAFRRAVHTRLHDQQRSGDGYFYSRVTSAAAKQLADDEHLATAERLAAAQAPRQRTAPRSSAGAPAVRGGRSSAPVDAAPPPAPTPTLDATAGAPLAPPPPPGAGDVPEPLLVGSATTPAPGARTVASTAPPSTTASELYADQMDALGALAVDSPPRKAAPDAENARRRAAARDALLRFRFNQGGPEAQSAAA